MTEMRTRAKIQAVAGKNTGNLAAAVELATRAGF